PGLAVVHGIEEAMAGAGEQHAAAVGVLGDRAGVVERIAAGQAAGDGSPGLAPVGGLEQVRIAVVDQMEVEGDVGGAGIEVRGRDLGDGAVGGEIGEILADVHPVGAAVFGVPELAVVGAGPEQMALDGRGGDGEDEIAVELAEVVADQAAGGDDLGGVAGGEVGTDDLPGLAGVGGVEDDLAAVVDAAVEGIDRHGRGPVAAVLEQVGLGVEGVHPGRDGAGDAFAGVVAGDLVAVAAGPDNIGIGGIGDGEAALAAAEGVLPGGGSSAAEAAAGAAAGSAGILRDAGDDAVAGALGAIAGTTHGAVVLAVGVDPVGDAVIGGDVIHLAVGNADREHLFSGGDAGAAVVGENVAARDLGVHPDVVAVAARRVQTGRAGLGAGAGLVEGLAAIVGAVETAVGDQHVVRVLRVDGNADVVAGAADEGAVPVDVAPGRAAIIAAPERALVGGLDERVHALGVAGRDGDVNLAHGRLGHAGRDGDVGPGGASVFAEVDAAAGGAGVAGPDAAELSPSLHHHLPGAGEQDVGVMGVHGEAGAAGVGIDEERAGPIRAAVGGLVDAALLLGAGGAAEGTDINGSRVGGIDDDAADAAGVLEAHVLPSLAAIAGLVDAVAHDVNVADGPSFAGAGPDGAGIRGSHGERADGHRVLAVENGIEVVAAIGGFPDAAGGRAKVIGAGIAFDPGGSGDAARGLGAEVFEVERGGSLRALGAGGAAAATLGGEGETQGWGEEGDECGASVHWASDLAELFQVGGSTCMRLWTK